MVDHVAVLEDRITELRRAIRNAARSSDEASAANLRTELRATENAWEEALRQEAEARMRAAAPPTQPAGALSVPVREQAHQALTVLGAPAGPKLIVAVAEAFQHEKLLPSRLGSLRRDEERSFAAQPFARPYYLCPALTHHRFTPVRGLLAVSTWPLEQRMLGPLGPRADFLTHASRIADQMARMQAAGHEPPPMAWPLLLRFALGIPEAYEGYGSPDPARVLQAARSEGTAHADEDAENRRAAAARARDQIIDPARLLFGL